MRLLIPLCVLSIACDPLPPVPVPMQSIEEDGVAPVARPEIEPPEDTAPPVVVDRNRAPVITTIKVEPATPRTMDDIKVTVEAEDPDGGHVRLEYSWLLNDLELRGQRRDVLPHTFFSKGDMVKVRVIAKDREVETEGSGPLIIVRNTPPEIVNKAGSLRSIDGYQVQAQDLDGDELSWRLEGHPEGMSIDSSTGVLSYEGSPDARAGDYQVNVIVEDPDKGSANWTFGISVAAGSGGDRAADPSAQDQGSTRKRSRGWSPEDKASEQEAEE
jgi:hypothetical protein